MTKQDLEAIAEHLRLTVEGDFFPYSDTVITFVKPTGGKIKLTLLPNNAVSAYGVTFTPLAFEQTLSDAVWCAAQWAAHCR